ncbi:MAG TPA: ChbG/HpnK family deacetylase [Candidatus Saccharimonadales bacterium]|nr:ChbG/HpnK family deacetylase [Candidatus Saccharimonadales bacterium]
MKRLIVNADDLGRAPGINAGIRRAHREGIVTAATLMVAAPASVAAGRLARELPGLDIGVHLALTYGRPITAPPRIPSLVEAGGGFPATPEAFLGTRRAVAEEALIEYRAQYERARELLGHAPTHLDSHHWLHDEPALEWAITELARETGAPLRQHSAAQRDRFRAAGLRTPDVFRRDFQHSGHIDVSRLLTLLAEIGDGVTELMCHPGEPDAELTASSAYAADRPVELATLCDPAVATAVRDLGITLATFADCR